MTAAETLSAWALTYLLHSSALIGGVWLLARSRRLQPRAENLAWKVALLGGVLTATLQLGLDVNPLAGRLAMPATAASTSAPPTAVAATPELDGEAGGVALTLQLARLARAADGDVSASAATASGAAAPVHWTLFALGAWLAGALLLGGLLARAWLGLRRQLADRLELAGGPVYEMLGRLRADAGLDARVRLTSSSRVGVPITWGLAHHEVCIPRRALGEMSAEHQEAMLAHELGHVARRDAAWNLLGGAVEAALFFQPLNRLATRAMRASSELACDEWATQRTRRPLALAGCLTEVAAWVTAPVGATAAAMADRPSGLRTRVEQLVAGPRPARRSRWLVPALLISLATLTFAAPGAGAVHIAEAAAPHLQASAPAPATPTPAPATPPAAAPAPPAQPKATPKTKAKAKAKAKAQPKAKAKATPKAKTTADAKLDAELEREARVLLDLVRGQLRDELPDLAAIRKDIEAARKEIRVELRAALGKDGVKKQLAEARKQVREAMKQLDGDEAAIAAAALKLAERAIPKDLELEELVGNALKLAERAIPTDEELATIVETSFALAEGLLEDGRVLQELEQLSAQQKREVLEELREEIERLRAKRDGKGKGKKAK